MKIKPSAKPGHVLLDLDEAGIRLLAKESFPAKSSERSDSARIWEEIHARATSPLKLEHGSGWRNLGNND